MMRFLAREKAFATQVTVETAESDAEWCDGMLIYGIDANGYGGPVVLFESVGSNGYAQVGDWILKDSDGLFFGYPEEDFNEWYEFDGQEEE